MSKRIMEVREENEAIMKTNDLGEDIGRYKESIEQILHNNLQIYSERQLLPFMRSFFSRKKASDLPPGHGTKLLLQGIKELSQGSSQGREMNTLHIKKILRNNLEEFM